MFGVWVDPPQYPNILREPHTRSAAMSIFVKSYTFRLSSKSVVTLDARETLAESSQ